MEFLKTCDTNAQAIGDFEAVAYQSFSVTRDPTVTQKSFDWNQSDDIRAAEAELRQEQHLVIQDVSKPWLWLFRPATADESNPKPSDLPTVEGFCFQREQYGIMKAIELARPPMRGTNPYTNSSGSMSSPLTPGAPKAFQAAGTRPQGSSQLGSASDQQQHDCFTIYELFTSSVVALISYYLVKDYGAIALNYRTFVSKLIAPLDPDFGEFTTSAVLFGLTNLDVLWTSSGTLVVSTFSLNQHQVYCLDDISSENEQKGLVGSCVRVAPSGLLAQIASFDDPLDAITEHGSQRPHKKRARSSPLEQGIERWKSAVRRWMSWRGYTVPGNEKKNWVKIRIPHMNRPTTPSPAPSSSSREILWPRALCFYYGSRAADNEWLHVTELASNQGDQFLDWFETSDSTGFKDPLDVAQQWFLGKPERDKIIESRQKAKKAEEEAARIKDESHSLFPSSPLNTRTGNYGDLQAVGGVYPTPPDGVPPGTAHSSADTPSVSGVSTNVILPPGGTNPAINLSAPQDTIQADGQLPSLTSPDFPPTDEQYHESGGNDDLFEDMEEDVFEGNGVTDADFNFFDEPDGDDVDMLDVSGAEESNPLSKGKMETGQDATTSSDIEMKEEQSDPMAALESALATASNQMEDDTQDLKSEQEATQVTTSAPEQGAPATSQIVKPRDGAVLPISREPTPPLSPRFIEQALLPSPKGKLPLQTPQKQTASRHRDSIFDPLNFSRKMSLSDAKYQEGRFSFPVEKTQTKKGESKDKSRPAKSLRDMPLLTKLRYAIGVGVAASKGIPELSAVVDSDSDLSDTSSETSSVVDEELGEINSVGPSPLSTGVNVPIKRKLPTDGNATPLSVTSFADSFSSELPEMISLQTDEAVLTCLEPTSWDWPLIFFPRPTVLSSTGSRFTVPAFSPLISSMPNTPVSQPDIFNDMLDEKPLSGKDSIAIAQIVTDQIVSATLDLINECPNSINTIISDRFSPESKWHTAIGTMFPMATDCSVATLASVPDVFPDLPPQVKGQQRQPPRKPNEQGSSLGHHLNQISAPHIRVRRGDSLWDFLPPALAFWEPLGLSPVSPAKNVVAFSIYPHSESLRPCVETFMVNMQLAYANCRLGSHTRVETVPEYEGGLVPWKISSPATRRAAFKSLRDTCVQLGKLLAAKHTQMRDKAKSKIDAFVIYMIDPFGQPSALWELCSAFWTLFQSYGQGPPTRGDLVQKPDLVLQVVPIKYVASLEAPVILDLSTYTSLAREVFDRCPPSAPCGDKTPLGIYTAPSFQLEEPMPRTIPFKLNATPPQDLLHENCYIHLGYAISLDGAWITVAWTDTCGKSQAVVSYNLGTRMFSEIAKEIWQTTIEILQARRVTWRVCIAKAGVMEKEEMDAWIFLVSCPTQLNLFITLLTVDSEPRLKFIPTIPPTNSSANQSTAGQTTGNTPGSTPQADVSPEHGLTPAATPSSENTSDPAADPDARLVDVTDETWGIILAHRLHNSNSTNEFRPALISGLIVKRGSPNSISSIPNTPETERGPVILAVNILWMGAVNPTRAATSPFPTATGEGISPGGGVPPSPQERSHSSHGSLLWTPTLHTRAAAENLLKEVLGQFRGLGLLARLKGVRGSRHGTVPWHVAASIRGVNGIGKCFPQ